MDVIVLVLDHKLKSAWPSGERKTKIMMQQVVDTTKVPTIESALHSLGQFYAFRRSLEVLKFLDTHSFLTPLLLEAHGKIAKNFGSSPEVILEVVTDPEAHRLVEMFGYIATPLTPEEARKRLQQFDREWFLLQVHRTKGLLNFDVEFR